MKMFTNSLLSKASMLFMSMVFMAAMLSAQTTVVIGTGTTASGASDNSGPIYRSSATSSFNFSAHKMIYTAAQLAAAGVPAGATISSIAYFKTTAFTLSPGRSATWTFYMNNSSTGALAAQTWGAAITGMTQVYNSATVTDANIPAAAGWVTIPITPFTYTGGTLEIADIWAINTGTGNPTTGAFQWQYTTVTPIQAIGTSNSVAITATSNLGSTFARSMNVQLTYTSTACSGATAGTAAASPNPVCSGQPVNLTLTGFSTGQGTSYQWSSSTDAVNFFPIQGATNPSYTATQTQTTWYNCTVSCSATGASETSNTVEVAIAPPTNCYCQPSTNCGASDRIDNVTLGTLNNASGCTAGGYVSYVGAAGVAIPDVPAGTPTTMSVLVGPGGTEYVNVWVDGNDDGDFDDAGEMVGFLGTGNGTTITNTIYIDAATPVGQHRMRVRVKYNAAHTTACATYTYGETEDYIINVTPPPACAAPGALAATSITINSASLNWSSTNAGAAYTLIYGPVGGSTTTLTGTSVAGANTVAVTGLTSNTNYTFTVQENCGGSSGVSPVAGPASFTTLLDCSTAPVLSCGTSTSTTAVSIAAGSGIWNFSGTFPTNSCGYGTPGKEVLFQFTATSTGTHYFNVSGGTAWIDWLWKPAAGATCDATGWTCLDDVLTSTTAPGLAFTLTAGQTYYIVGDAEGTAGAAANIWIECPAACPKPLSVTASAITTNSATINWTEGGTATVWNIEYGVSPFTPGTGAGTVITGTSTKPYTLSGLNPSTTYQVYVQADCSGAGNGTSAWSTAGSFSTTALPPDCAAGDVISCGTANVATINAGAGAWNVPACGFSTPGLEKVYQFTPTTTGAHRLVVNAGNTGGYFDYYYKEATGGCSATGWTCIDDINGAFTSPAFNLTAGTTYYFLLDRESSTGTGSQTFAIECASAYYQDLDGDTYGNADSTFVGFAAPTGYVNIAGDCNDNNAAISPAASEAAGCNGVDENCNGIIDETGIASFTATVTPSCTSATGNKIVVSGVTEGSTGSAPAPYTYSKDGGVTYQTSSSFTALAAGIYNIVVSSANGCTQSQNVAVLGLPVLTVTTTPVSCNLGSNGTATVAIAGGQSPYSIEWKKGTTVVGNTATVSDLTAGTYNAYVTDALCPAKIIKSPNAVVTQPAKITIASVITRVTCHGGNNGAINITVAGGTAPYSFLWSNGATTEDISGLVADTFLVSVTDANGCLQVSGNLIVRQPTTPVTVTLTSVNPSACANNGSVTAKVTGGTKYKLPNPPYTYSWSNGVTTLANPGLGAGTYTFVATDSLGCQGFASATLTAPAPLQITSITSVPAGTKYTVTLASAGGTPFTAAGTPYKYRRVNTAAYSYTNPMLGVTAGTYTFEVQDARGCTASMVKTIPTTLAKPIEDRDAVVANTLSINPNPASDVLNVRFGGADAQGELFITDAFNRTLLMQKVTVEDGKGMTVQLDRFVAGMYNLTFVAADGTKVSKKFVVVKN